METPRLIAGLVGALIGWGAHALTMEGRVAALEAGVGRIEGLVTQILTGKPALPPKATAWPLT